jgi:Carboxypeptidase regulatory-like domain
MRKHLILGVALHLAWTSLALAQTATGVIRGRVEDTTGAVITDVHVTLVDERRNQSWDQTTNSEGFFEFRALPFGDYRLQLERPGFKKEAITDVGLEVAQTVTLNVTLQAGRIASRVDSCPGRSWLARSLGREFVSGHRRQASSRTADERA